MMMVRDILMYMDRTYVVQQRRRSVYDVGLHLFQMIVWEHPAIKHNVISCVLQIIASHRAGILLPDEVYPTQVKTILTMLLELGRTNTQSDSYQTPPQSNSMIGQPQQPSSRNAGSLAPSVVPSMVANVYQHDFEEVFLGTTQEFYQMESLVCGVLRVALAAYLLVPTSHLHARFFQEYLGNNTAVDYVQKAMSRLSEEMERVTILGLPHATTEGPLLRIVQTELIERHSSTLVATENLGFTMLLRAVTYSSNSSGTGFASSNAESADTSSANVNNPSVLLSMRQMYDLCVRVPSAVEHLRDAVAAQIRIDGQLLTQSQVSGGQQQADPPAFIRGVLDMRQKYESVIATAFRGGTSLQSVDVFNWKRRFSVSGCSFLTLLPA
jgi:cullin 3